jgi:hypothetical protein
MTGRWLFVLSLSVYVLTAGGSLTSTDAVAAFDVTRNIVEHGSVALTDEQLGTEALRGRDGRYYSPFGIAQSVFNIPFYLAGKTAASLTGLRLGKPDTVPKAAVALAQTLVGATIVWQIFGLSLAVTGAVGPSLAAALTFAFGSVLWPYARFGFNQPHACVALVGAVHAAWLAVRRSEPARFSRAALWLGVGLLTRHELGLAILPMAGWLWWSGSPSGDDRRRRLRAFVPMLLLGVGTWLAFNAIRFGNPLDSGHLRDTVPGFGSPIVSGLAGLLFSPSASLFLYSPVALFGLAGLFRLWRRDRATAGWLLSLVLIFVLFYATLGNWIGGRSYGSRYLVIVLPFLAVGWAALLAAVPRRRRIVLAVAVLGVGIVVQLPGVLMDYAKVSQAAAAARGGFSTAERQWAWEAAPLVLNAAATLDAVPANVRYVMGLAPIPAVGTAPDADDRGFSQQFAFSLDFWWLYLFYMGALPRMGLLAVVTTGLGLVVLSGWALARSRSAAASI